MEINYDQTIYKVTVYGTTYKVRTPFVCDVESFGERLLEKPNEEFKLTIGFLDELGLPEEVARKMEVPHVWDLVNHLSGKKKPS